MTFAWNEQQVAQFTEMWVGGTSAKDISDAFDGAVSRSAVLGKVNRMGLQRRIVRVPMTKREKYLRRKPLKRNQPKVLTNTVEVVPIPPPAPAEEVPLGQRRSLFELTDETCRWPYGDPDKPDFFFCGAAPVKGTPYCRGHARIAYNVVRRA